MSAPGRATDTSFVVMQIGDRRVALPAAIVAELAPPVRLHCFPHTAASVTGVIVRRGRIVPVYEADSLLATRGRSAQRFYLIARRMLGQGSEWAAIAVDGECELVTGELQPRSAEQSSYIAGTLEVGERILDVLDFEALVATKASHGAQAEGQG
jgi:chemotaxis signal transduction protein